jgi:D-xylulose reductase
MSAHSEQRFKNPSVYLYGPGDARIEEYAIPAIMSSTDAIIEVALVGVCGSDVYFWNHGGVNGNNVSPERPLIMGHEGSGTVREVDSAVSHLKIGDKVAIEGSYLCRLCTRCKEGLYNLCPQMKFAASPPDTNGMLTRYFKAKADMCYKLPESASLEEGALVEPLAVAAHAVRMAQIKPGQTVVIFGSGTIGLVCGAVAQ